MSDWRSCNYGRSEHRSGFQQMHQFDCHLRLGSHTDLPDPAGKSRHLLPVLRRERSRVLVPPSHDSETEKALQRPKELLRSGFATLKQFVVRSALPSARVAEEAGIGFVCEKLRRKANLWEEGEEHAPIQAAITYTRNPVSHPKGTLDFHR